MQGGGQAAAVVGGGRGQHLDDFLELFGGQETAAELQQQSFAQFGRDFGGPFQLHDLEGFAIAVERFGFAAGAAQFQAALLKVTTSPDLVALDPDDRGQQRFTTREMLEIEAPGAVRKHRFSMNLIEARQQAAAERWRANQLARKFSASADINESLNLPTPDLSLGGMEDELEL